MCSKAQAFPVPASLLGRGCNQVLGDVVPRGILSFPHLCIKRGFYSGEDVPHLRSPSDATAKLMKCQEKLLRGLFDVAGEAVNQ